VRGGGFADLADLTVVDGFDVVVNATSASLAGEAPPLPASVFATGALAYDMMYGKGDTAFLAAARRHGAARLADGLGMLVEQAAEAFFVWRGVRPQTAAVLAELRGACAA
jgi:shikimate dehydrogenase